MLNHLVRLILVLTTSGLLLGCGSMIAPHREAIKGDMSNPMRDKVATVFDEEHSVLDIEAGFGDRDVFIVQPLTKSDPLPKKVIKRLDLNEAGLQAVLVDIFRGTGYSISFDGGAHSLDRYGSVSAFGVAGPIEDVMANLSATAGFFYRVEGNSVRISFEEQFVVDLPPILHEDNLAGMVNTMQYLGARDVYLDRQGRTVAFRVNKRGYRAVEEYLNHIRTNRSMLVYDLRLWQVDLTDQESSGINWNKFERSDPTSVTTNTNTLTNTDGLAEKLMTDETTTVTNLARYAALTRAGSGFGLGAVFVGSRYSLDMLLDFLKTQGSVRSLSQPRIALMAGSKGRLRIGQTALIVTKVGTNITTALNQVTVETTKLETGLNLELLGEVHDNTIHTRMSMYLSDLVRKDKFTALGTDMSLPTMAEREYESEVRSRPGDTILLGGIIVTRDVKDDRGGVTSYSKNQDFIRSELVMAMRPRIVRFTNKQTSDAVRKVDRAPLVATGNASAPIVPAMPASLPLAVANHEASVSKNGEAPAQEKPLAIKPEVTDTDKPRTKNAPAANTPGDKQDAVSVSAQRQVGEDANGSDGAKNK